MNKKITTLLIISIIAMMFVPLVSAAVLATFSKAQCQFVVTVNVTYKGRGTVVYTDLADWTVSSLTVYLSKAGSPTGTLYSHIAGATDYSTANSTVYAEALNSVDIASLNADTSGKTSPTDCLAVTFYYPNSALLDHNYYTLEVFVNSTAGLTDNVNEVLFAINSVSGNMLYLQGSTWSTEPHSLGYILSGTSATTGSAGTEPDDFWDTGLGAQIFAFIPTLTSLIIVLLAAFLGWKFAGPWGFFAGINLGYIISVIFNILPLWGFIALLVVDGLLLFGKVGFRN